MVKDCVLRETMLSEIDSMRKQANAIYEERRALLDRVAKLKALQDDLADDIVCVKDLFGIYEKEENGVSVFYLKEDTPD